jgi:tetratricopeptide (TPR) repeat protein
VEFKNGLAISYQYLGYTHTSLSNLDKALGFYEEYNCLENELYAANLTNVEFKNGLAISYQYLGSTQTALGNLDKALEFYEEYNRLEKELNADYPNNVEFKNGLAISYQYLGNMHTSLSNLDKALGFYEEYNHLENELYATNPTNVKFKNLLAISYQYLGNTHMPLGNLDKGFEKYIKLSKELYAAYPTNVSFKNSLAISYVKLASFYLAKNNIKAKINFKEAEKYFAELHELSPNNAQFKQYLDIVRKILVSLDAPPSIFDLDTSGVATKQMTDYKKAVAEAESDIEKLAPQSKLVTAYENLLKTYKGNKQDSTDLSNAYGSLAWYQMFNRQFSVAEQSAQYGLALDASQEWINANLAVALLYQGKWKVAKRIYLSLKDKPYGKVTYKEMLLSDLDELEKEGILHADMAKIRVLLKK